MKLVSCEGCGKTWEARIFCEECTKWKHLKPKMTPEERAKWLKTIRWTNCASCGREYIFLSSEERQAIDETCQILEDIQELKRLCEKAEKRNEKFSLEGEDDEAAFYTGRYECLTAISKALNGDTADLRKLAGEE